MPRFVGAFLYDMRSWIFRIIGAALGFYLTSSWIGALFGGFAGMFLASLTGKESSNRTDQRQSYSRSYSNFNPNERFSNNLNMLSAAVMKADGKVLKSELNYVKTFFHQQFGPSIAQKRIFELKELLNSHIQIQTICWELNQIIQPGAKSQVLYFLFGIAQSDGHVSEVELNLLTEIANALRISPAEFNGICAMFVKDTTNDFTILGIEQSATDAEIKKAYRKLAIQYHPDKAAQLGPEYEQNAKEKFQKIQEAYENIKKERGF